MENRFVRSRRHEILSAATLAQVLTPLVHRCISVDDGFLLWRTGNEAFTLGSIGTPTQVSVAKYLNPHSLDNVLSFGVTCAIQI
jgi:hypothetical protein